MLCSNAGVHFYNYFIFLPDKTFVSGENEFAEIIDEESLPEVQIVALDNLFDDILPLPNTPTTSKAASMATSPQNSTENPVASTSKDPVNQAGTPKTTPTPNAQKTPPSGTRKSPRNATAAKTFTRRRDADSSKAPPPPPEYLSKDDIRKTKWKNVQFCVDNSPSFKGDTALPAELENLETPWQFFNYFFPLDLFERILEETMRYISQKNISKPVKIEIDEIYRFVGICILTSVIHLPNTRSYWSTVMGVDVIREAMAVNRFELIKRYIHFNDNEVQEAATDENRDRLFKLRPIIDRLLQQFQTVPFAEQLSLDEQMCATKNRSYLKNYLPNKPHKWGYKLYVLSDTSGFVHNFEVYTGAVETFLPNEPNLGAAGNVVMRLCRFIKDDQNHKLYYDNYYSSVPLAIYLFKRGIQVLGTINKNRIPDSVFQVKRKVKKINKKTKKTETKTITITKKKSKFSLPDTKELDKQPRGSVEERLAIINDTPLIFLAWKDNRVVSFLSTFIGSMPLSTIKRYDRKIKMKTDIPCPAIVKCYNQHMGGVDLLDSHISRYKIHIKSRKWYLRLFFHFIDLAIINSWLMWRKLHKRKESLAEFKAELGEVMCKKGYVTAAPGTCGRPTSTLQAKILKKRTLFTHSPSSDTRLDRINHWPIVTDVRNRCRNPDCTSKTSKTSIKCSKCNVFLCLNTNKSCFVTYHTNNLKKINF